MTNPPKRLAVIGDPVAHSLSPAMHNAALQALGLTAEYVAIRVALDELESFANRARNELSGFNVTVPHKNAIIPYLDSVSPEAEMSGSVNTVTVTPDGKLRGESTDGYGLRAALREAFNLERLSDAPLLFIGCGGAARAVAFDLAANGATRLMFANRTVSKAEALANALKKPYPDLSLEVMPINDIGALKAALAENPVLIQSTSVGLKPDDPSPVNVELLTPELRVFDMIYRDTALLKVAASVGCPNADGRGMLLWQGVKALEIWTQTQAPVEVMRQALNRARNGA